MQTHGGANRQPHALALGAAKVNAAGRTVARSESCGIRRAFEPSHSEVSWREYEPPRAAFNR